MSAGSAAANAPVQPLLESRLAWVDDRLVLGHVLFLDRGDLSLEPARDRTRELGADGHVVVVSLMARRP